MNAPSSFDVVNVDDSANTANKAGTLTSDTLRGLEMPAGVNYSEVEDCGLFWSNDPEMPIGEMVRSLGLDEYDPHLNRHLRLQDQARGRSVRPYTEARGL